MPTWRSNQSGLLAYGSSSPGHKVSPLRTRLQIAKTGDSSTHWPLRLRFWKCNVKLCFTYWYVQIFSWQCPNRWMSRDLTDDKSTLVQAMAWCRQTTSHYPSQCWLGFMSPYYVSMPQCVSTLKPEQIFYRWGFLNTVYEVCSERPSW